MNVAEDVRDPRARVLRLIAIGSLALFVTAVLMIVVGDPWWNFYVVALGLFAAPPVGLIALFLRIRSRRRALA